MKRGALVTTVAAAATLVTPAHAEGPKDAPTDARHHSGFRGRLDVGMGDFAATSAASGRNDRQFNGTTLSLALTLGWEIAGPCTAGGMFALDHVYGLAGRDLGTGPLDLESTSFTHRFFGASVDCYLRREGGLRFFAAVGYSELDVSVTGERTSGSDPSPNPDGLGYVFGTGYDVFTTDRLSLGIVAKLTVAPLTVTEVQGVEARVTALIPTLGLSLSLE